MQHRKEVMRKPVLLAVTAVSLPVALTVAITAWAAQPVFDAESAAKAAETINELKKHGEAIAEGNKLHRARSTLSGRRRSW